MASPKSAGPGNPAPATTPVMLTYSEVLESTTKSYLAEIKMLSALPSATEIERTLIARVNIQLVQQNNMREGRDKFSMLKRLEFSQVAQILIALHRVVRIAPSGKNTDRDYDLLAIYVAEGEDEGIYATSEDQIRSIARRYDRQLTINGTREVMAVLREEAPRLTRSQNRDLIAVNNGIFDYQSKRLLPFDPDIVFISKARVDYVDSPTNPVIPEPDGSTWDVERWVASLSDDPEIVNLIWEILGAIVRPHVRWNKSAWLYSEQGNNGKGTLCELMRNLVGSSSYASIPIADFGKDFLLEPLTRASAIIVDENDVGGYIDRAANLKAVVTNDVISINRKYKMPIAYQFYGFMVQCLNEYPRIKDKSESFYRRQLFVPFTKTFTGRENKAIKNDYLHRPDVLQYVLHRVLHMDYYQLSEPEATQAVLADYKIANDPVRAFWDEFETQLVWDLLPFQFAYDLYKAWFVQENPSGSPVGRNTFIKDALITLKSSTIWYCADRNAKVRTANRMSMEEPLVVKYQLLDWGNTAGQTGPARRGIPRLLADSYRGLQRHGGGAAAPASAQDANTTTTV